MKNLFFCLIILFSVVGGVPAQNLEAVKVYEFETETCEIYRSLIDGMFTKVDKNQNSKGYVFVYAGRLKIPVYDKSGNLTGSKIVAPPKNLTKELIKFLRRHAAFRDFTNRTVFIDGGFRETFTVEFWIVPAGTNPPKKTPTLSKINQRKSIRHPYGYCGEM